MNKEVGDCLIRQPSRQVKDAIIAAAGYGTRLLPFTTQVSKEFLPIGGVPVVQLLIDECIAAGIENIRVMTRSNSGLMQQHFSGNAEYARFLRDKNKTDWLKFVEGGENKYANVQFIPVDREIPYGNAQGVLTIKDELSKLDRFLLLWGDDVVLGGKSSIEEIVHAYEESDCDAVVGAQKVDPIEMHAYGNIKLDLESGRIVDLISKPKFPDEIISPYAQIGQMVLPGNIFDYLGFDEVSGEPDVTAVALKKLAQQRNVMMVEVSGQWVTIGDPVNYLKAQLIWFMQNRGDKALIYKLIEDVEK